jgi:hypothetical protein
MQAEQGGLMQGGRMQAEPAIHMHASESAIRTRAGRGGGVESNAPAAQRVEGGDGVTESSYAFEDCMHVLMGPGVEEGQGRPLDDAGLRREFDTHADITAPDNGERRMSKAGLASFMRAKGLAHGDAEVGVVGRDAGLRRSRRKVSPESEWYSVSEWVGIV